MSKHEQLKIAQIAPLHESVPPKLYGGTERVVAYLTDELIEKGHDVTLYASGDSTTKARLVALTDKATRLDPDVIDPLAPQNLQLERVFQELEQYDIVHFHTDYLHFPLSRRLTATQLTTMHSRLDTPDLNQTFKKYREMPLVSISDNQRRPLPKANWQATVYNGIEQAPYRFRPERGRYLAFLGRICPDKGIEDAIEISLRSGVELKIAAKIDKNYETYFQKKIAPLLKHPLIEFVGEINESEKSDFLGNAAALIFPIQWPEPFGLVMIESLACGTPVIAFRRGAVPEILQHGVTGIIVDSVDEAVSVIGRLGMISRYRCRQVFEKRFSASSMTEGYLRVYENIISRKLTTIKAA